MRRAQAFTLIELMVVLTIIGIVAALAVPNMVLAIKGFDSKSRAQDVLHAVRAARSTAIRENRPIRLIQRNEALVIQSATLATTEEAYLVAVDDTAWTDRRSIHFDRIHFTSFPASGYFFCPSGEARYRLDTTAGAPLCPLGDLVAPTTPLAFEASNVAYGIELRAALGSARMRLR